MVGPHLNLESTRALSFYDKYAERLHKNYQLVDPIDASFGSLEGFLRVSPGFACDIGAGSGRDANWLAEKGWDVIAVEPSSGMRDCIDRRHLARRIAEHCAPGRAREAAVAAARQHWAALSARCRR